MKKLIRPRPIHLVEEEWNIDIYVVPAVAASDFVFDTESPEYTSFIGSMVDNFESFGYTLYNDPEYTHRSNRGPESWYYTFVKAEGDVEIRVVVNVRISDHKLKDKPWRTASENGSRYVSKISREIAEREHSAIIAPLSSRIDVVIDGKPLKSYHDALFYLHDQLVELEEAYQQWKKDNNLI